MLRVPIQEYLKRPFQAFTDFYEETNIPQFSLGEFQTYLMGQRSLSQIGFVQYNSSWSSKDDEDKGKLWIGLPQLKYMESKGHIPHQSTLHAWPTTRALIHHNRLQVATCGQGQGSHHLFSRSRTLHYSRKGMAEAWIQAIRVY